MKARALLPGLVAIALLAVAAPILAQRGGGGFGGFGRGPYLEPNIPYDGRFVIARVMYGGGQGGWWFDYPEMERNFSLILNELTSLRPVLTGSNILTLDDPELMRYPIIYFSEPGYWQPNAAEIKGLRDYLNKGGFAIFDDFMQNEWWNFAAQMARVLPGAEIVRLDNTHPIFDSFFRIENLAIPYPNSRMSWLTSEFYGIHENNDPTRRLIAIINYNTDIGDYMEWSHTGRNPIPLTNEAYKLAVNYIIYGMTR